MSPGDEDISAALPRPPPPAPARREAAIAAALRRFDGVGEVPAPVRRPARAAPWRRPYFGALAGAALVALIALPLAWTSLDDRPYRSAPASPPAREARPRPAARAVEPLPPPAGRGEAAREPATASDEAPVPAAP
ncbi:MAG TPA: hypothetical protein VEA60_00895, partial [Allosphingosinicella sp.]|nr:hypothetical protein [Allosphingosinicella sp.]